MKFEEEWSFLNPYQMTAVLDVSPACVVNANVGSGKTTVLIAKILYLYQVKQIQPEEMIVLTFTNKAADEIKERLIAKEKFLKKGKIRSGRTHHCTKRSQKYTLLCKRL